MRTFFTLTVLVLGLGFSSLGSLYNASEEKKSTYTVYNYSRFENFEEVESREEITGTTSVISFGMNEGDLFSMTIGENPREDYLMTSELVLIEHPDEEPFQYGQFSAPAGWGVFQYFDDMIAVTIYVTEADYRTFQFYN